MPVETHPDAVLELEAAVSWYREYSYQTAVRFRADFQEKLSKVLEHPQIYGKVFRDFRACLLSRYP